MWIKPDKDPFAVNGNCIYIVYNLDAWTKDPTNNFKFQNCLFGVTNMVKNSYKENYVHSGCGIAFDRVSFWSFDNDTAKNVIIFGVDNSSSSHSDNLTLQVYTIMATTIICLLMEKKFLSLSRQ